MEFKDYYQTLGVAKTATGKEIKQAFRKLARKHHPDVNPGDKSAESRIKDINEAYEVLGDAEKRKKYDELGANWRMYEQAGAGGGPGGAGGAGGFPPGWNVHFGGGQGRQGSSGPGGSRTMTEEEMRDLFGGDSSPFSDFFNTFFGGGFGGGADARRGQAGGRGAPGGRQASYAPPPHPGRDMEHEIDLGLEDAFHGTMRRLSIQHEDQVRNVDVRIPAGVGDGSRVRVPGEGEHGTGGAQSGDLYLRVRLMPHARFEKKGRDLYTHVPVPLTTAVLGGEADVTTLDAKPLRLKIPPTTQNGQIFRLKGHGMPAVGKPTEKGDLYATVDVQLPRELSAEQRAHYEALQKLEAGTKNPAA